MRTNRMTERIAFVSYESKKVNGVPVDGVLVKHMTVWAEVPKVPIREANDPQTKLGTRKDSPTFLVRFLTAEEIQPTWRIQWRGNEYQITGLDPDYERRDLTTITAKLQFGVAKEARAAVRDGAQKFADKLKSNTPEWDGETDMSGHLRDDIKLSSVRETSGVTEVDVGYGKNTGWRAHFPNSGTSMQDPQHFIEETQEVMRPVVIAAFLSHLKEGGM